MGVEAPEQRQWLAVARGRVEVEEVAVGVAEQHGAVAPGLAGRLLNPVGDGAPQARTLRVDVADLEFQDRRAVGRRGRRSGVVRFPPPRADEGQDAPLGVQFDVIFTSEGRGRVDTGDGLVKRSQGGQVVGDDSQRGELHGDVPFVGCRAGQQPGGRPRETVRYSTVALRCQGEERPVTRSGAETSGGKADKRVRRSRAAVLAQTYELLSEGGIGGGSIDEGSRGAGGWRETTARAPP